MVRYETYVEAGVVYVTDGSERITVGDLEPILETTGGHAWTIQYTEREKQRYSSLDTSDEGLTIDVVDAIHGMSFGESFAETLKAQPAEPVDEDTLSPRLGLFVGRLLENLDHGVR